jgi:hypothetical protein
MDEEFRAEFTEKVLNAKDLLLDCIILNEIPIAVLGLAISEILPEIAIHSGMSERTFFISLRNMLGIFKELRDKDAG